MDIGGSSRPPDGAAWPHLGGPRRDPAGESRGLPDAQQADRLTQQPLPTTDAASCCQLLKCRQGRHLALAQ
jgi:hypothetical protein